MTIRTRDLPPHLRKKLAPKRVKVVGNLSVQAQREVETIVVDSLPPSLFGWGDPLKLVLSYPVSVNRLHTVNRHTMTIVPTSEARAYKKLAAQEAIVQGARAKGGAVFLVIRIYRPQQSGDIDNRLKTTLDALNEIAWTDDGQIIGMAVTRHDDPAHPRIEVDIRRMGVSQ